MRLACTFSEIRQKSSRKAKSVCHRDCTLVTGDRHFCQTWRRLPDVGCRGARHRLKLRSSFSAALGIEAKIRRAVLADCSGKPAHVWHQVPDTFCQTWERPFAPLDTQPEKVFALKINFCANKANQAATVASAFFFIFLGT